MGQGLENHPSFFLFTITAIADPALLPRILGFFAQDNLVPQRIKSHHFKDGDLVLDLCLNTISDQRASVIAEKLRQLIPVKHVHLERTILIKTDAA